jgi:hypothetical protein
LDVHYSVNSSLRGVLAFQPGSSALPDKAEYSLVRTMNAVPCGISLQLALEDDDDDYSQVSNPAYFLLAFFSHKVQMECHKEEF